MKNITIISFFIFLYSSAMMGQGTCDRMADSLQLVALYNSTDGPNWSNSWDLTMPMNTWYGIGLNADGCVRIIEAWGSGMDGTLPMLDLPFLERLDLSSTSLDGPIPDLQLPSLTYFNAFGCQFDGLVPNFSGMPNLEYLNLSSNYSVSLQEFTHLPNLIYLNVGDCLAGLPAFDSLPNLEYIYVGGNITSLIPTLASSTQMKVIRASWTDYEQAVPDYSHMPNLHHLGLRASHSGLFATGSFVNPAGFPSLTYLGVDNGAFTFDDLLPFAMVDTFIYAPQYDIEYLETFNYALVGETVELHVPVDSFVNNNVYEWKLEGQLAATTSSNSYWIQSAAKSDSGEYVTTITNPTLPDLTLKTRPFQLYVYDSLSNIMIQPDTQQNIQPGAQIPLINMSFSPNQPLGMRVFYIMTDTLGNVLKTVSSASFIDISYSTVGVFRVYGGLSLQGEAPQIGDNIFAMDDSLRRFKVSDNFMPIIVGTPTSIDHALDAGLELMPNPATDILRFHIPESLVVPQKGWTLEIMTLEGQVVHHMSEVFRSSIEFHVGDYPTGVYLLRLRDQEKQWNMRWVKE